MEYDIRDFEARRLLVVGGQLAQIGELWHRCGDGFHDGWLASAGSALSAIAYVREEGGVLRYYAGVPVDRLTATVPDAASEGFELLDVPGGRYAMVNHQGPTSAMHDIAVALKAAARAAGDHPDGGEIELYHPTDGHPDANVDMGARLAD